MFFGQNPSTEAYMKEVKFMVGGKISEIQHLP